MPTHLSHEEDKGSCWGLRRLVQCPGMQPFKAGFRACRNGRASRQWSGTQRTLRAVESDFRMAWCSRGGTSVSSGYRESSLLIPADRPSFIACRNTGQFITNSTRWHTSAADGTQGCNILSRGRLAYAAKLPMRQATSVPHMPCIGFHLSAPAPPAPAQTPASQHPHHSGVAPPLRCMLSLPAAATAAWCTEMRTPQHTRLSHVKTNAMIPQNRRPRPARTPPVRACCHGHTCHGREGYMGFGRTSKSGPAACGRTGGRPGVARGISSGGRPMRKRWMKA